MAIPGFEHLKSAPIIACCFSIIFCFGSLGATLVLTLNVGSPREDLQVEHVEEGVSFRVTILHTDIVFDHNLDRNNQRTLIAVDGHARVVRTSKLSSTSIGFTRVRITI